MSSWFDAYFGAHAAPVLMNHMASNAAVTIVSGEATVVENAAAILRHQDVEDRFTQQGEEQKVLKMQVDLLIDDSLSFKGLADDYTNAKAIVFPDGDTVGEAWSIDRIDNKTETFQRLELIRKMPRGKYVSGRYRDS